MNYYSYKMVRDFGFAPNPFMGVCTLSSCKPGIRKSAQVDDWIIGTGGKTRGWKNRLIYAMKVSEKLTFEQYWDSPKYQLKKPVLGRSLVRIYGDNIYHKDENGNWLQADSHHSLENGEINTDNLEQDTRGEYVLTSDFFYYFGNYTVKIPSEFSEIPCNDKQRDYKKVTDQGLAAGFISWLGATYEPNFLYGKPIDWGQYQQLKMNL